MFCALSMLQEPARHEQKKTRQDENAQNTLAHFLHCKEQQNARRQKRDKMMIRTTRLAHFKNREKINTRQDENAQIAFCARLTYQEHAKREKKKRLVLRATDFDAGP